MKSNNKQINILVLNCGSSSLKYKVISMPKEEILITGEAQRVGIKTENDSTITHIISGKKKVIKSPLVDHSTALKKILNLINQEKNIRFDIIAHRYVHPGNYFNRPVKVTKFVLTKLKKTLPLAPIHNPIVYNLIKFCHKEFTFKNQYAVFDTSFHKTIPPKYSTYALPRELIKKYDLRRIGFHGLSHRYVMEEACRFLKRNKSTQRIISCHLGTGGSSICAIREGKSVNSSMGFTPLEGLMMNTRCGDIDLGIVFYIMFKEFLSPDEAENILNKKSGILGIFNTSSDLRDVIKNINNDKQAKMVFNMYVCRVKAYIGFYSLILKKADILIFTDSLGVEEPVLRKEICENMELLGIKLDERKNYSYCGGIADISSPDSEVRILVIPTNEEIMIAREVYRELKKNVSRC